MTTETITQTNLSATANNDAPAQRGEIITPPPGPGLDASLIYGQIRRRIWTNLDLKTDDGLALAMMCEGEGGKPVASAINETILLRAVYIHDWSKQVMDEQTGELITQVLQRTVLIAADGMIYSCSSTGVLDSLRVLIAAKGQGPWDPPLPVKLLQIQFKRSDSGEPGRIFKLQYVPPAKPAGGRGRK